MNQSRCRNDYLFCYVRVPSCCFFNSIMMPAKVLGKIIHSVGLQTAVNDAIAAILKAQKLQNNLFLGFSSSRTPRKPTRVILQ